MLRKEKGYWTKEKCHEEALKYISKKDFLKNAATAHWTASKNNWLNEICSHMITLVQRNYLTKEYCKNIIDGCENKQELREKYPNILSAICKNNWLEELCCDLKSERNKNNRFIYAYEFSDNYVYVGLTVNIELREKFRENNIKDSVTEHKLKTNIIPERKILEIAEIECAPNKEIEWIEFYKNNNWNILNKIKGGNLGSPIIIWTKEKIYLSALKHKTKNSWRLGENKSAYNACKKYGEDFFNECTKHMVRYVIPEI